MLGTCLTILLMVLQDPDTETPTPKRTGITVDYEGWMTGASGSTEAGNPTANQDGSLNFSDDLLIRSGSMMTFGLQYGWRAGSAGQSEMALRLEYQRGTWTGRGTLRDDIEFDNEPFSAGTNVASRLRFDNYRLEYAGDIALDQEGLVHLILGAGVGVIYGTQRLAAAVSAESVVGVDFQVGFEAGAKVQPWRFAYAQALFEGYCGPLGSRFWEVRIGVGGQWGPLRAEVGYRIQQHSQLGDLHLRLQGFYFGVAADF